MWKFAFSPPVISCGNAGPLVRGGGDWACTDLRFFACRLRMTQNHGMTQKLFLTRRARSFLRKQHPFVAARHFPCQGNHRHYARNNRFARAFSSLLEGGGTRRARDGGRDTIKYVEVCILSPSHFLTEMPAPSSEGGGDWACTDLRFFA